jgi:hypothetical protein
MCNTFKLTGTTNKLRDPKVITEVSAKMLFSEDIHMRNDFTETDYWVFVYFQDGVIQYFLPNSLNKSINSHSKLDLIFIF